MTQACAGTPTPIPGNEHTFVWSAVSYLNTAIVGMFTGIGAGWVLNTFAPYLVDVDALCASNPTVPEPWATGDWVRALNDIGGSFPNPSFMVKLDEYVKYGMFQTFCQCSVTNTPPTSSGPGTGSSRGLNTCQSNINLALHWFGPSEQCSGCQYYLDIRSIRAIGCFTPPVYVWDPGWFGGSSPPGGCNPSDPNVHQLTSTWSIDSPSGVIMHPGIVGPFPGSASSCAAINAGEQPFIDVMVSCPGDSVGPPPVSGGSWGWDGDVYWQCVGGAPEPNPPPTSTPPTLPTNNCGTDTLCSIQWTINNLTQNNANLVNNTNRTTTNIAIGATPVSAGPVIYVLGPSHVVTGKGLLALGDGTVGVLANPASPAPGSGLVVGDPDFLFDQGVVTFENANGWGKETRVSHDPQVIMSDIQVPLSLGYDCEMSGSMTITELVPPATVV